VAVPAPCVKVYDETCAFTENALSKKIPKIK
jgi:hypothetical protein